MGTLNDLFQTQMAEKILKLQKDNEFYAFRIQIERRVIAKNNQEIQEIKEKLYHAIQNGKGEAGQQNSQTV